MRNRLTILLSLGALALALAPLPLGLAGILLLGFALAPIYPMLMSRTPARLGPEAALHAVGFQVSAAMLGVLALPTLAGLLADRFGLEATAWTAAGGAAVLFAMVQLLLRVGPGLAAGTFAPTGRPDATVG